MTATIVGVAPPGLDGASDRGTPAVFVPMSAFAHALRGAGYDTSYDWSWLELIVGIRSGTTVAQATVDLTAALAQSWRTESEVHRRPLDLDEATPAVRLAPVQLARGPDARLDARVSLWTTGIALVVLLIACANVTNLLLSRTVTRQRELAMRVALGIGRGRLIRHLVLEGLGLGLLGAVGGVVLARVGGAPLRALVLPEAESVAVVSDPRTLVVACGLATVAGLLTAVVPAWFAGRLDVITALKSGGRGATAHRSRLQGALVVAQAALSVVLLVGAGLFVRSLQHAERHRLGYDAQALVFAEVNLRGTRVDDITMAAFGDRLVATAAETPGVTSAAMVASVPFWSNEGRELTVAGHANVRDLGRFTLQAGSANFFATTGTRILRGRPFDAGDRAGTAPVIVVSEAMARTLWPGQDALGQCVRVGDATAPCRSVIGVAEEASMDAFAPSRRYTYYVPVDQYPDGRSLQVYARVSGTPEAAVPSLRSRLQAVLPGAAFVVVRPLAATIAPQFQGWRFGATMFVAFGGLALIVALLGLHSLIAYESARREQEFGVRLALGATPARLLATVVGRGTVLALAGIVIGLGLTLVVSQRFEALLFEQSARDPVVLGAVGLMLLGLAAAASAYPAIKTSRLDPSITLRAE